MRAGLVHDPEGLEAFGWSSVYRMAQQAAQWLEADMEFSVAGCQDSAGGRREFLVCLRSAWTGGSLRTPACRFQRVIAKRP